MQLAVMWHKAKTMDKTMDKTMSIPETRKPILK